MIVENTRVTRAGPGAPTLVPGPDIIVGDLPDLAQIGSAGSQVGLAVATTSCNNGDQPVNFLALPNTDHPVVPQNLYRMSGGADNTGRLEQIGQSWIKHTFGASEFDECNLGCNTNNCIEFSQLCPGCSDPYNAGPERHLRPALVRVPGSILSPDLSRQTPTTIAATFTMAYRTGSWLRRVIWCPAKIRGRPILAKPPTLAPMNTRGACRIPGSATCLITTPTDSSQSGRPYIFQFSTSRFYRPNATRYSSLGSYGRHGRAG